MQHTVLHEADLTLSDLRHATLDQADLQEATLVKAYLDNATLQNADLRGANLTEVRAVGVKTRQTKFDEAVLHKADWEGATLVGAVFDGADLSYANLSRSILTDARFFNATFYRTLVDWAWFDPAHHMPLNDGTDRIEVPWHDRFLNWGLLRLIGRLPFFGVSYAALLISITVINTTHFLNEHRFIEQVGYPLPLSERWVWLMVGSLLVAIGATTHRVRCPQRLQEFSEWEWVAQHGQPRLFYLADKYSRRAAQALTLLFTLVGGLISLGLLLERLLPALRYAAAQ
jgi:hypothetical protein